jgi:tetratricopeptide (TPR) repeat protein
MASTNHGLALLAIGDLRGARAAQERAVRLLRDAHGDGHLHVQLARRRLAGVLVGLGDLPAARDLLETALDRQLAATGPDDPDVGRTHALLALALRRSGETAAAARHADRAREVLGAALEESTPEVRLLRAVLEARVGTGAGRTG